MTIMAKKVKVIFIKAYCYDAGLRINGVLNILRSFYNKSVKFFCGFSLIDCCRYWILLDFRAASFKA